MRRRITSRVRHDKVAILSETDMNMYRFRLLSPWLLALRRFGAHSRLGLPGILWMPVWPACNSVRLTDLLAHLAVMVIASASTGVLLIGTSGKLDGKCLRNRPASIKTNEPQSTQLFQPQAFPR